MARRRKQNTTSANELDPAKWAHATFAVGGFLAVWVFTHLVESGWDLTFSLEPVVGRPIEYLVNISGILLGLILTIWAWRRADYFKFITEVVIEVSQVTWPTRAETRSATWVVTAITVVCSVILWIMDNIWKFATDILYGYGA